MRPITATFAIIFGVLVLICVAFCAGAGAQEPPACGNAYRLEDFTWSAVDHKLTINVSCGTKAKDGKYSMTSLVEPYELEMDFPKEQAAPQMFHGTGPPRLFDPRESVEIHRVMAILERYAIESVGWWESGAGKVPEKAKQQARR